MKAAFSAILWGCAALLLLSLAVEAFGAEQWRGIRMEPEKECSPYDPMLYPYDRERIGAQYWINVGAFFSPYDNGAYHYDQVDLEHRVARHQAHVSGMCSRSRMEQAKFANDVRNITWATPHINRELKGDKDAAGWMPPVNQCHFAMKVAEVKCNWQMSVDEAEAKALDEALGGCEYGVAFYCKGDVPKERVHPGEPA